MPVWCEVVADTLTPVSAFANLVGDGEGFLFESVEGGERWGRYSFVGRRPLATLTARGKAVRADRAAGARLVGRGDPPGGRDAPRPLPVADPRRAAAPARRAGRVSRVRRGARDRAPAGRPPGRPGPPRCRARGHRPVRRVRPLAPAHLAHRQRGRPRPEDGHGRGAGGRLRGGVRPAGGAGPRLRPDPVGGAWSRRHGQGIAVRRGQPHHELGGVPGGHRHRQGVHHRGRHLPGRALPAFRPRSSMRTPSTSTAPCACSTRARTCTSCASPR